MEESNEAPERWDVPFPYGIQGAIDSSASVAAPLLAGFTVTLIAQIIGSADKVRWSGAALFLLVGAALLLLTAVQAGIWVRQFAVTPKEIEEWWPDANDERREQLLDEQQGHRQQFGVWMERFRWAYHGGIVLLLAAIAVALVPSEDVDGGLLRYAAAGLAAFGAVAEIVWLVAMWRPPNAPCARQFVGRPVTIARRWRNRPLVVKWMDALVPPSQLAAAPTRRDRVKHGTSR